MSRQPPPSEVLAHWRYTPAEWLDFVAFEREFARKEFAGELKKGNTGCIVALIVLVGIAVPLCKFGASGAESLVFGLLFAATLLVLMFGGYWLVRQWAMPALSPEGGEVYITPTGVKTDGRWFGWGEPDTVWLLSSVRRKTFHTTSGRGMEFLVFRCQDVRPPSHRSKADRWEAHWGKRCKDKELRVPIPFGKVAEADAVAERLVPARDDVQSDGHDFRGGACRKCGSSREAAESFGWECKSRKV